MNSLFRIQKPSQADLDSFHNEGYIFFPDVLKDQARELLIKEIYAVDSVRQYLDDEEARSDPSREAFGTSYFVRPWNDRGPAGHQLIDDPFIAELLQSTIGPAYHFCHSALNLAPRGRALTPYHQDHHHWNHDHPVNHAEREKYYIQILYYPNGFKRGDRNLKVIPGSHRIAPLPDVTPERILAGEYDSQLGRKMGELPIEASPGSMVYLNARLFHAVEQKPDDSPQPYRLFNIDVFKQAGPPHRFTQEIPPEWIERADPYRKKLFLRDPYTKGCWTA